MAKDGTRRGRPPGTPNKANAHREARIAMEGVTPLRVMLDRMRFHYAQASKAQLVSGNEAAVKEALEAAGIAARDVAPYVHPRLSAVLVDATIRKHDATDWTRDELVALINDTAAGRGRVIEADGRDGESDIVH